MNVPPAWPDALPAVKGGTTASLPSAASKVNLVDTVHFKVLCGHITLIIMGGANLSSPLSGKERRGASVSTGFVPPVNLIRAAG